MNEPSSNLYNTIPMRLSALFQRAMDDAKETFAGLQKKTGIDRETLSKRVESGNGWRLDELVSVATHLKIPQDALAEAVFPDRPVPISVARLEHQLRVLEDENAQLRQGRYEPHIALRDLLLTGEWSVSALPLMSGPVAGREILSSVYLTIAPLVPTPEDTTQSIRAQLARKVPMVYRRAAVLSGGATRLPKVPGVRGTEEGPSLSVSIPVFSADRDAPPKNLRTPVRYSGEGILVVASTNTSGAREISALLARALGWGVTSTRTLARILPPQIDDWDGRAHRLWLREESNRQLSGLLIGDYREKHHVYCHWDHAVDGDGEIRHPLIDEITTSRGAVDGSGPFVVFLNEDTQVLEDASGKPYQERPSVATEVEVRNTELLDSLRKNRDALRAAIPNLPPDRRFIVPVRALPPTADADERIRGRWQRHVLVVRQILAHLGMPAEHLRIADREARTILQD